MRGFAVLLGGLLFSPIISLLAVSPAHAAGNALIVVAEHSTSGSIDQQLNARIALTAVVHDLGPEYSSIEVLSAGGESDQALAQAIRKNADAANVDVLVLAGDLRALGSLGRFRNLRLMYFSTGNLSQEARLWRRAGAHIVVGERDFTASGTLASTRFIHRWAEGWSAARSARDAADFSGQVFAGLKKFSTADSIPELLMLGTDTDRLGDRYSFVSIDQGMRLGELAPKPSFYQSPFQSAAVSAASILIPSVHVQTESVPDVRSFLDRIAPFSMEELQNIFPPNSSEPPAVEDAPGSREMWIDGEFLKYLLAPLKSWAGGKLATALELLQGIKLMETGKGLKISVYFSHEFDVQMQPQGTAKLLQLLSIHIPKTVRVGISDASGSLVLKGLDDPEGETSDRIFLNLNVPVFPGQVYLRNAALDLATAQITAEAGILGDTIGLIAHATVQGSKINPKVDLWQSIADNSSLFTWPVLSFERAPQ